MRNRLALSLIALALTGCSSTPETGTASLNVRRASGGEQFTADFDRALFSNTIDGQTDLVLLRDTPAGSGPGVQQAVHVTVFWQPTRTIRLDSPSAGNAMIDWVVSAGDTDKIVYGGSCWARVSIDGDEAAVDLREADVTVRQRTGRLADPLTRAKLAGKFVAKRADAVVKAYVDDIRAGQAPRLASIDTANVQVARK